MKPLHLLSVAALAFSIGCGGSGPVGTFTVPTVVENPPVPTRLSVDKDGTIHDAMMNGEPCAWALDEHCVKRCFPVERLWPGCTASDDKLWYTRQGLTTVFAFGRVTTIQDPACSGNETNTMVNLFYLDNNARPTQAYVCGHFPNQVLTPSLYDRAWYEAVQSKLAAATFDDLPRAKGD